MTFVCLLLWKLVTRLGPAPDLEAAGKGSKKISGGL